MNELTRIETDVAVGAQWKRATDVAGAVKAFALSPAGTATIQGKRYPRVETWMAIANAYGCCASARDVEAVAGGIRAIGEVRRLSDGLVLATGEGFVGDDEPLWAKRPLYARRAMAQTRAISRACRSCLAFVVPLIDQGLSTTPAEEMDFALEREPHGQALAEDLKASLAAQQAAQQAERKPEPTRVPDGASMVFPPFGRAAGKPIAGASRADLERYALAARRSLADPSKERYHAQEQARLAAIEAELARLDS